MKTTAQTKVLFRMFRGEVLALFPQLAGSSSPYTCMSYAHVGQHSAADPLAVIHGSRRATAAEFASLEAELRGTGYTLNIAYRQTQADLAMRKAQLA